MDSIQLTERICRAVNLGADDIKALEQFGASLPEGWQDEVSKEGPCCFGIHRSGVAASLMPAILIFLTDAGYYSLTTLDAFCYQDMHDYEVFDFETIEDTLSEVRSLICEFMQTADPSWHTPESWKRCLGCDAATQADCLWFIPVDCGSAVSVTSDPHC